ncbi:MAG: hypothetical protein WA667_00680 [Candidatus Nitrosopolaris sp.]
MIKFLHVKMVKRNQLLAVLAIAGLIGIMGSASFVPAHPAYARHHSLNIVIHGQGSVDVWGHGRHAPDVNLDCEPSYGFRYSWHVHAECD